MGWYLSTDNISLNIKVDITYNQAVNFKFDLVCIGTTNI